MSNNTTDDRSKELLEAITEIVEKRIDKRLYKLQQQAINSGISPEELLQGSPESLLRKTIAQIQAERTVTDARTGHETVDVKGEATNTGFSNVAEYDSDELRERLETVKTRISNNRQGLQALQSTIESKVVASDPAKAEVTIDLKKDINLRNAVRRIFGKKKDKLTFSDYKKVLKLRSRFDKEETSAVIDDKVKL